MQFSFQASSTFSNHFNVNKDLQQVKLPVSSFALRWALPYMATTGMNTVNSSRGLLPYITDFIDTEDNGLDCASQISCSCCLCSQLYVCVCSSSPQIIQEALEWNSRVKQRASGLGCLCSRSTQQPLLSANGDDSWMVGADKLYFSALMLAINSLISQLPVAQWVTSFK